jgi:predicted MFS family arabinose efflux permease
LPIAAFVIWRSLQKLPDKAVVASGPIDWKGIVLLSSFLFFFAITLFTIAPAEIIKSLLSFHFIGLFLFSLLLFILLIIAEKRVQDPVVRLSFFENRQLVVVLIIASGAGIFQASFVYIPGLAVSVFGVAPSKASFMLIPSVMAVAIGAPLWGRLLDKIGSRIVIASGLTLTCAGLFLISRILNNEVSFYIAGALFGLGLSALVGSSLRYVALNEVSAEERATSQGMMTIFISTGQIVGSVLIGVIAAIRGETEGFKSAFFFISAISFILIAVSILLKSRKNELAKAVKANT